MVSQQQDSPVLKAGHTHGSHVTCHFQTEAMNRIYYNGRSLWCVFFACSSYQVFLQMCVKLKYARSRFIFSYNFHHFIAASGSVPELVYLSSTVVINKMNCREVFFFFLLLSSFVYYSVEIFMFLHTVCVWQQLLISALVNGAKVCQTGLQIVQTEV